MGRDTVARSRGGRAKLGKLILIELNINTRQGWDRNKTNQISSRMNNSQGKIMIISTFKSIKRISVVRVSSSELLVSLAEELMSKNYG